MELRRVYGCLLLEHSSPLLGMNRMVASSGIYPVSMIVFLISFFLQLLVGANQSSLFTNYSLSYFISNWTTFL